MEEIKLEDVQQLLEHFSRYLYKAKDSDTKVSESMLLGKHMVIVV